jgi:hypothetical protein
MSEDADRAAVIAASGSGGSAVYRDARTAKFGEEPFGGPDAVLSDDAGHVLVAKGCGLASCVGSHVWEAAGVRLYCAGPDAAHG